MPLNPASLALRQPMALSERDVHERLLKIHSGMFFHWDSFTANFVRTLDPIASHCVLAVVNMYTMALCSPIGLRLLQISPGHSTHVPAIV